MKLKPTQTPEPSESCSNRLARILTVNPGSGYTKVESLESCGNRLDGIIANPANGYVKDVVAAGFLGCSVSRLRSDRFRCRGLPFYRFGRSILYKISDIEEYLERTKIVPAETF